MRLKFLLVFLITSFWQIQAQNILEKRVDLELTDLYPEQALLELSSQSGVEMSFSKSFFKGQDKLNLKLNNVSLEEAIQAILGDAKVQFKVLNGRIVFFRAKKISLSGYVVDRESGESLISATVFDTIQKVGVITNEYGYFSLQLDQGPAQLVASFVGYEAVYFKPSSSSSDGLRIELPSRAQLEEVLIKADAEDRLLKEDLDQGLSISPKMVGASPSLGGEEDYLRVAQLIPGVNSGIDGFGGLQVRGGEAGQNMMLLDGVTVFIPYHLLGVYSIYNPNTVRSAKLWTGNFPARYGGRLSSILDVRTREGNQNQWQGSFSSNLINVNALVEGPLNKGKGSIIVAGRYSPTGQLFNNFFRSTIFQSEDIQLRTTFYDLNVKLNYQLGKKDRVFVSFFNGTDLIGNTLTENNDEDSINSEINFDWNNTIGSFRWNHLFNDNLFANTTFTYSNYGFNLNSFELSRPTDPDEDPEFYLYSNSSRTYELGLKTDLDYYLNNRHKLRFGAGVSQSTFAVELSYFDNDDVDITDFDNITSATLDSLDQPEPFRVNESYLYVEDQISFNKYWQANFGLRLSYFLGEGESFLNLEPRLLINYNPNDKHKWHFSTTRMVQYIHLISSAALRLPSDLWLPSSPDLEPQKSWQTELGYRFQISKRWELSSTAYFKDMQGLYAYVDSASFLEDVDEDSTQSFLTNGSGLVLGLETSLRYNGIGRGGVISYTLSKSERQFADHNLGNPYPHDFDQRHRFKIFLYQDIGKFQVGLNWVYYSPNPRISFINMSGGEITRVELNDAGKKNELRAEAYHRMDLSISYKFQTGRVDHKLKVGVYNLYNRDNVALYETDFDEDDLRQSFPIGSLGLLPSVSYKLNWK